LKNICCIFKAPKALCRPSSSGLWQIHDRPFAFGPFFLYLSWLKHAKLILQVLCRRREAAFIFSPFFSCFLLYITFFALFQFFTFGSLA